MLSFGVPIGRGWQTLLRDALIYFAKRTNQRIVLNALARRDDISQGRVKTVAQARAYVWMLLQPYISSDNFGMAVLSDTERTTLYEIAVQTPMMMTGLNRITSTDDNSWQMLPCLLIKLTLASI